MKILIRNSDSVVMYADDSMVLSADGVKGSGWTDHSFTILNATLANATLPENWTGAVFAYSEGAWSVADQAALDDKLSAASVADVPAVVTMAQARKALILGGVSITAVNEAIAAIPDATERQLAETDWEYSTTVRRDSALVASLAPLLGLTSEQIDGLFIAAAKL